MLTGGVKEERFLRSVLDGGENHDQHRELRPAINGRADSHFPESRRYTVAIPIFTLFDLTTQNSEEPYFCQSRKTAVDEVTSAPRHNYRYIFILWRVFLARATFLRMSQDLAIHTRGFGFSLW